MAYSTNLHTRLDLDALEWQPIEKLLGGGDDVTDHASGVMASLLAHDPDTGAMTYVARIPGGYRSTKREAHSFDQQNIILEGEVVTDYTTDGPAQFVIDDWARVGVRVLFRSRARRLFEQEKLTFEHDFTVWTGESEFYPLVEPRNFVPTYSEAFYAPAFGWWYQYGGLQGSAAAARPNALEPPPDHPLRRAMELLEEAAMLTSEEERRERFQAIADIAAANVWSISIATPPPQLVVVKQATLTDPALALPNPHLVNLDTDPKERNPVDYPYLHTWVGAHAPQILGDYQASLRREPLIPLGAPLDYVPRPKQP